MVIDDMSVVPRNSKNVWHIGTFQSFAANGVVDLCYEDERGTDVFFHNSPPCIAYETFKVVIRDDRKTAVIVWIARMDACMTLFYQKTGSVFEMCR